MTFFVLCFLKTFSVLLLSTSNIDIDQHYLNSSNNYKSEISTSDTTFKLVAASSKTYGYEIIVDKKVLIRQITIPGLPGNRGFKTKVDAGKVANLVIKKLKQGLMPPTVEKFEMDKLKIKYHY